MSLRGVRHVEPLARRTAPVTPLANIRGGALGPLPQSRTTEQSPDFPSHVQGRLPWPRLFVE